MRRSRADAAVAPEVEEADVPQIDPTFDRRRAGLAPHEIKGIVRLLRSGKSWEEATRHVVADLASGVLERWKPKLLKRAASGDGPVLPDRANGATEPAAVPPALAELHAEREERVQELRAAQGRVAEIAAAMVDADAAVKVASARAVAKAGKRGPSTKAAGAIARAKAVLQDLAAASQDAEREAEEASAAVGRLDDAIVRAQAAHGLDRERRLKERSAAWLAEHGDGFLADLARVLSARKHQLGAGSGFRATPALLEPILLGIFGMAVAPDALARRIAQVEESFLAEAQPAPASDQKPAPKSNGRRRGEASC